MYLGIDLGTSGIKATLIDSDQAIVASAQAPLTVSRPQPGWSEQDPADWISATGDAIDALHREHGKALAGCRGIGLSGQMHGATLLDRSDRPLRPCILWNDTRSAQEAAELDSDPRFRRVSGNVVFPGFTAPKVSWVGRNEPDVRAALGKVLLPKDYLRLWLTGEYATDASDASGTSWFDTANRAWSEELLAATGLDAEFMPAVVEGTDATGTLKQDIAARFGMQAGTVVAGGGGDNAASACGMGVVAPGTAFVSLGTSGVIFVATDSHRPDPGSAVHAFCHAVPGTWHQMGVILAATDSLNWLASITGTTPAALTGELDERMPPPGDATFLPYLGGERTPHNSASVRGMFAGLGHSTNRSALAQATLEGVAFALRDNMAALAAAGTRVDRVLATGGGSRSRFWLQTLASVLNVEVIVPASGDFGAAFGAARLGMVAAESLDPAAVMTQPRTQETLAPDVRLTARYDAAYDRYRTLAAQALALA